MFIRGLLLCMFAMALLCITGCGEGECCALPPGDTGQMARGSGETDPVTRFLDETPPADLSDPATVASMAGSSDPRFVLLVSIYFPVLLLTDDESCPAFIDESNMATGTVSWRIQGGCSVTVDGILTHYDGRIVAEGNADGTVIRWEDFRISGTEDCDGQSVEASTTMTGEVRAPYAVLLGEEVSPDAPEEDELMPAGHYETRILVERVACAESIEGFAYDASIDIEHETWEDGGGISVLAEVFQMEGRTAERLTWEPEDARRVGLSSAQDPLPETFAGSWEMSAVDFITASSVCESEAVAGTLTLRAGDDEVVIFPDGATGCDDDSDEETPPICAPWSQDGEMSSEPLCDYVTPLFGGCSAGPDAPPPWSALAILLAGLLWQRRRERRAKR